MSWIQKKTEKLFKSKYFDLRVDECETTSGKTVPRYFIIDFPDWVQVVALDEEKNLILVDQYRYPGQGKFVEFPGGSTHSSRDEEPLLAVKRELLEETGYESDEWIYLGPHFPNPALQSNRTHAFLAKNCRKVAELNLDPFEELEVVKMPVNDFIKRSRSATTPQHSLMLATLFLALPYLE